MKVKVSDMLKFYSTRAVRTNDKSITPPPNQAGYVMGGDGRVATDDYIRKRAIASYSYLWESYYDAYKKWIGHEVYDCNALAEAFYKRSTGISIDTKAKYNYANWCSIKSNQRADRELIGLPQMRGVAVFLGGNTSADITHVGFLYEKYGEDNHDWLVLESRGKDYGVVLTTLKSRPWSYWGVMDKYFEYETEVYMSTVLKLTNPLMRGEGIKQMQLALNALGYDCGTPDGICGKQTIAGIEAFCKAHTAADNVTATIGVNDAKYTGTLRKEQ